MVSVGWAYVILWCVVWVSCLCRLCSICWCVVVADIRLVMTSVVKIVHVVIMKG